MGANRPRLNPFLWSPAVAWSLVGEWSCRELFLPPKGAWPRNCHPAKIFLPYDQRSVPLHTWARACFEQGSLPSLLSLPGKASMLVLPGDKMSQSQFVAPGKSRPAILHGYGSAKKVMKAGLTSLAEQGWQPLASAMVGVGKDPPLWACNDWRPTLGTSVDIRTLPEPLTSREELLLLTQWARTSLKNLSIHHAAHTWLHNKKDLPCGSGPECPASPHSQQCVHNHIDKEISRYLAPLYSRAVKQARRSRLC